MLLAPPGLGQWFCDTCGEIIRFPREGTVEYRCNVERRVKEDFRIVHNGNVGGGRCQNAPKPGGDMLLEDLLGTGAARLLEARSTDATWEETERRVRMPHYEEARRFFPAARAAGREIVPEKLTERELLMIIKEFSE